MNPDSNAHQLSLCRSANFREKHPDRETDKRNTDGALYRPIQDKWNLPSLENKPLHPLNVFVTSLVINFDVVILFTIRTALHLDLLY